MLSELTDREGRPRRRVVVEAAAGEVDAIRGRLAADIVAEAEVLHTSQALGLGGQRHSVTVVGEGGDPIRGAVVRMTTRKSWNVTVSRTNAAGHAELEARGKGAARLEVSPIPGHWSIGMECPAEQTDVQLRAVSLPPAPDDGLGWWHHAVGAAAGTEAARGIRVGVIDSGCGPHPALSHARTLGTFTDGRLPTADGLDADEHGTHVCGIVGARPARGAGFAGLAQAADLVVARVQQPGKLVSDADMANALDAMVTEEVDLVNMSLGAQRESVQLLDSIIDAWTRGTVCFAAAGNTAGDVLWPARHERVVAVTAVGRRGVAPPRTLSASRLQRCLGEDVTSDLVFPDFCCRGLGVTCCAPGVAIISTIPIEGAGQPLAAAGWADMDGTSMACPVALGVLAVILGKDSDFLHMSRDEDRARHAWDQLEMHCVPTALDQDFQGNGLPMVDLPY